MKLTIAALILLCPGSSVLAQKLDVKIVNRQDNDTDYSYFVPSHFSSQSNSTANCNALGDNVNCNGSTTTNGVSTAAHQDVGLPYPTSIVSARAARCRDHSEGISLTHFSSERFGCCLPSRIASVMSGAKKAKGRIRLM
jgi:hypothetical protein